MDTSSDESDSSISNETRDPAFYRYGRSSRFDNRQTRAATLPKIIEKLEMQDPTVKLDDPESAIHKSFTGTSPTPCVIFTDPWSDKERLPANTDASRPGVHLTFKISGATFAKHVTISAKVAGSNVSKLHESSLKFFLGAHGQVKYLSYARRTPIEAIEYFGREVPHFVIGWMTSGGYRAGLEPADDYDEESVVTFALLDGFSNSVLLKSKEIRLAVVDVPGLEEELQSINWATFKLPWAPYLDTQGTPQCSWGSFPKRVEVKRKCGGLIPVPPQNSFATVSEAQVILANGICLEYRQSPKHDPGGSWPDTWNDQTYLKRQLLGVENLMDEEFGREWQPALLNQSFVDLPVYDPLEFSHLSQEDIGKAWTVVEEAFSWDESQKRALRTSRALRGRIGVIEGGPGSGKTAVLAAIAVSYACCDCPVLLFAPMIAQARALVQAVESIIGRLQSLPYNKEIVARLNIVKLFRGEAIFQALTHNTGEGRKELKSANILIALPYVICSNELELFASRADKFLILHDDSNQLTETEIWGTVLSMSQSDKCEGLIMSTDVKEWPLGIATLSPLEKRCTLTGRGHQHHQMELPWMYSTWYKCIRDKTKPPKKFKTIGPCCFAWEGGTNEFAEQTGVTFVSRLLRQRFPSVMLKGQHRLRETLATHMNTLVYRANRLNFSPIAESRSDIDRFHALLRSWLGHQTVGKDMSVIFLEASYGRNQCIKARGTTESKRNHRNVDVVYDLLIRNHRAKAVDANDIKIVTQYKDQVRLYELEFSNREKESKIKKFDLPKPLTLDIIRGRQAKAIIYDLVVTCGDEEHGLGIMNNEFRAITALTRASDTLIIVGSRELMTLFPQFWKWMNRRTDAENPLPLIVRYANMLKAGDLSFDPPTPSREACYFPIQESWHSKGDGYFDWEWDKNNKAGARE